MVRLDEDDYYDDDDDEEEVGVRIRRETPMLRYVLAGTCLAVLLGVAIGAFATAWVEPLRATMPPTDTFSSPNLDLALNKPTTQASRAWHMHAKCTSVAFQASTAFSGDSERAVRVLCGLSSRVSSRRLSKGP